VGLHRLAFETISAIWQSFIFRMAIAPQWGFTKISVKEPISATA